ncbi:MAG TPA: class I tRNA ligase family protein, partial [Candidatus Paceibacterota bacterium]|nr:class I tRNA ligase family protein [Candidatus Paceibacterota bacterium]
MEAQPKTKLVEIEEKVLKFWDKDDTFKKSLEKPSPLGEFVFYDGPPFATGLPHFGHLLPTTIKDIIPRYKTMQGYHVRRRWGWDCHGLPVENLIEKELGLKNKKDIEQYGIEKFNEAARGTVLRYADEWKKIIPRIGRWVDMENDYRTMDSSYTESVWWAFKALYDKGLVYEGYKTMQICPHCGTTLSNFEVTQGYKDVSDISVYVKFELVDEPNTFLIAWTTTPWTLPGNVALAVGANISYSYVTYRADSDVFPATYVVAEDRVSEVFADKKYEIVKTAPGMHLIGKKYKPIFDYYSKNKSPIASENPSGIFRGFVTGFENGWKVYAADFVKTDEGTGIVHIAPAFGEEDMKLGQKENLPFIQHVGMDGKFKSEMKEFAGMDVKPKSDDEKVRLGTDIAIIKYLQVHGSYFDKKKITHPYPHCWRCDTPLLNYATSSWFVKVTDIKDKLVSENNTVSWVPENVGKYRFGNWLEDARDWAISRSRFWGAPIPIWKCETCKSMKAIGSLDEIRKNTKPRNRYILMRHAEAENNVTGIVSVRASNPHPLTQKGREQAKVSGMKLRGEKIDMIISSPFVRTRETAEIVAKTIDIGKEKITYDTRLGEFNVGIFDGKLWSDYKHFIGSYQNRFTKAPVGGETLFDVRKRVLSALYDLDQKYEDKTILIVSHDEPLFTLFCGVEGIEHEKLTHREMFLTNGAYKEIKFVPLPHDKDFKTDFHRPYIDHIELDCICGGKMKRVPEVFDCWFESGSMPFAEVHYPHDKTEFNPKKWFGAKGFPADFIAEGLDQTRGWFYSMLVLGVGLFGKTPYKNVIVNGLILAEDGQKMSKSKNNFPPLMPTVDKYGADSLRYFLASSPSVRAEDVAFSEKGVDEVSKKLLQRLDNVLVFYETYADETQNSKLKIQNSGNVLDQWIIARLNQTIREVTSGLETYELDKASRPIMDFVDDVSNWYLRRSRDRFKSDDMEDKNAALNTTRFVLQELSKIMAPFTPFYAEHLYFNVTRDKESVHMQEWPKENAKFKDQSAKLIEDMKEVRKIVTLGLEIRAKANIKVRQPLTSATLKKQKSKLENEFLGLIKDELNVKSVVYADMQEEIILDTNITPELREEGVFREFLRAVQELRKKDNLSVADRVA